MPSTAELMALVPAGTAAGIVGSAGGIASLVSYPALLAAGVPALTASVTNSVALVAIWPGSALASQSELRGRGAWLRRWTIVAMLGGVTGAALLLATPSGAFDHIVPWLVAVGALALWFEPQLRARRARRERSDHRLLLPAGVLLLSAYNGYFGAGSGVMMLTLMMVLVERDLPIANALKNMLIGPATVASAASFAVAGSPDWAAAGALALGALIGSTIGPRVARRLPTRWLRFVIVLLGLTLAVHLWLDPAS